MDLFTRHRRAEQRWRRDARTGAIHGANFKSQLCKSFGAAKQWCFDTSLLFGVTFPSRGCLRLLIVHGAQRLACAVCHRNVLTGAIGTNMCCMTRAAFTPKICLGICIRYADFTGYDENTISGVVRGEWRVLHRRWPREVAQQGSDQKNSREVIRLNLTLAWLYVLYTHLVVVPYLAWLRAHMRVTRHRLQCKGFAGIHLFFNVGASGQRQFKS